MTKRPSKKATQEHYRPPRLKHQLIGVAVMMLTMMTAYEWLKQILMPDISIWESPTI